MMSIASASSSSVASASTAGTPAPATTSSGNNQATTTFFYRQHDGPYDGQPASDFQAHRSSASSLRGLSAATDNSMAADEAAAAVGANANVWYAGSPPTLRSGRSTIPQTPNTFRSLTIDTPGLSSSASQTPAGGATYDMPWTPVQLNYSGIARGPAVSSALLHSMSQQQQDGKPATAGLQLIDMQSPLPASFHAHIPLDGGISMSRIASAPLPYQASLFETPNTMTTDLPMTTPSYTPDTYMWQSQDSYFPGTASMSRSMTEIQQGPASISPMVIMERTLSSSSSMPSLHAAATPTPDLASVLAQTPSSVGKVTRRRQRRSRDPPEVSSERHKPHVCEICKQRFIRLEHLKRHWKTHSNERPYPCSFPGCNKSFGRTDNRSQHEKTHDRAGPLNRGLSQLLALTNGEDGSRNDPHNAARSSAFAALEAASRQQKRHPGLDGPIALTQPGSGNLSPGRNGGLFGSNASANYGNRLGLRFTIENDENQPRSLPSSPNKLFRDENGNGSPPLQLRNRADLEIKMTGMQTPGPGPLDNVPVQSVDPFGSSYQHFGGADNPTNSTSTSSTGTANQQQQQSSFMGQPLLYTITENELQFVASGAVASYPLTPSLTAEPPIFSPSALGLINGPSPGAGVGGGSSKGSATAATTSTQHGPTRSSSASSMSSIASATSSSASTANNTTRAAAASASMGNGTNNAFPMFSPHHHAPHEAQHFAAFVSSNNHTGAPFAA